MKGPRKSAKHDSKNCNQKRTMSPKNIIWQDFRNNLKIMFKLHYQQPVKRRTTTSKNKIVYHNSRH